MKMSSTRRFERLGSLRQRRHRPPPFLGLTAARRGADGVMTSWGRARLPPQGSPLRRLGRRGAGGDRQVCLPALHAKTGNKVVQGSFDDEDVLITKIKSANPGDYQIVHSSGIEYYKKYVDLGWTSEINEGEHPEHGERSAGDDRAVPQADAEDLDPRPTITAPPASPTTPRSSPKPRPRRRAPIC
jgi:spermidine/putrescine transport system substrate-binding protein